MPAQTATPLAPLAVSITQAAQLLNTSRPLVYSLIESGDLRCTRLGRSVRIPISDIHAVLGLEAPAEK